MSAVRKPSKPPKPKSPQKATLAGQRAQVKQRVLSIRDVGLNKTKPRPSGKKAV